MVELFMLDLAMEVQLWYMICKESTWLVLKITLEC